MHLHAIGGEQVLLCRVAYEPGKQVPRHAHEHTEQVMVDHRGLGDDDDRRRDARRSARATSSCVNRGIEHELYSEDGVTFFEALAPVPLDHVPDRERDLVLGRGRRDARRALSVGEFDGKVALVTGGASGIGAARWRCCSSAAPQVASFDLDASALAGRRRCRSTAT